MLYKLFFCLAALLGFVLFCVGIQIHSRNVLVVLVALAIIFGAITEPWGAKTRRNGRYSHEEEPQSHSNDEPGRPK